MHGYVIECGMPIFAFYHEDLGVLECRPDEESIDYIRRQLSGHRREELEARARRVQTWCRDHTKTYTSVEEALLDLERMLLSDPEDPPSEAADLLDEEWLYPCGEEEEEEER